jgi:hypothetical protein
VRELIISTNPPVPAVLTDPEVAAIYIDGTPPGAPSVTSASAGSGSSVTVKGLPPAADLPLSNAGLAPGAYWNSDGFVCVVPNGGLLATSSEGLTPQTLWDNGGFVCVA